MLCQNIKNSSGVPRLNCFDKLLLITNSKIFKLAVNDFFPSQYFFAYQRF